MKRIVLFILTNLAVLVVVGIVLNIVLAALGIPRGSMAGLMIFALLFGMGGSFISLAMSKWIAKKSTGAQVIEQPRSNTERWLVDTVQRQAQQSGIGMPEVAVYDSPEINAFATGMNRNNALVAVSTGLLQNMDQDEVEAVLAHEVSHVANGDMVTLALIQGVVNAFVIFLARVVGGIIDSFLSGDEEEEGAGGGLAYFAIVIVLEILFGILASVIVMWFSRQREYRADAGGARLAGRDKMIAALQRLRQQMEPSHLPDQMAAFGIRSKAGGLTALFSSHPPLEQRIEALRSTSQF
jgi:heat shock protein HtpX